MRAFHARSPHHRFHRLLILIGLLLLLMPLLLGSIEPESTQTITTYKWRDDRGQLHLTDTPPPKGVPYETVRTPVRSGVTAPSVPRTPTSLPAATLDAPTPKTTADRDETAGSGDPAGGNRAPASRA